jgi:hypothetical protein
MPKVIKIPQKNLTSKTMLKITRGCEKAKKVL